MKLKLQHHFDAAHRLEFHEGLCRNLHGHRWEIIVEIEGYSPDGDMIIDFGKLKQLINEFDHCTILRGCEENKLLIEVLNKLQLRVKLLNDSPTAENLSIEIQKLIDQELRENYVGEYKVKVTLFESPGASIEYEE